MQCNLGRAGVAQKVKVKVKEMDKSFSHDKNATYDLKVSELNRNTYTNYI